MTLGFHCILCKNLLITTPLVVYVNIIIIIMILFVQMDGSNKLYLPFINFECLQEHGIINDTEFNIDSYSAAYKYTHIHDISTSKFYLAILHSENLF